MEWFNDSSLPLFLASKNSAQHIVIAQCPASCQVLKQITKNEQLLSFLYKQIWPTEAQEKMSAGDI